MTGPPTSRGTSRIRLRPNRKRRPSSTRWLERQLNDPFTQSARAAGYRSRAAHKLLEIDRAHRLLAPGRRVLDLGCAPGAWAQVAVARGCKVVGLDLLEVAPIGGVVLLQGDVLDPASIERALAAAGGPVDLVLSDLAASATGQRAVDRLRAEAIVEAVLALLPELLVPGGKALIKLLHGAEAGAAGAARRQFAKVRLVRPEASRRASSEIFLLATGFAGPPAPASDSER